VKLYPANRRRFAWTLGLLVVAIAIDVAAHLPKGKPVAPRPADAVRLVSTSYRIDRLYASMQGPLSRQRDIYLAEAVKSSRYWITGVKLHVVNGEASREESQDWFCHANLTLPGDGANEPSSTSRADPMIMRTLAVKPVETPLDQHRRLNPDNSDLDHRLFTLVPGRNEIEFPEGFGIPMRDVEPLELMTMALNLNTPHPDKEIRFSTDVSISTNQTLNPVFRRAIYGHVTATPETTPRPEAMCVAPLVGEKALMGATCGPDMMDFRPAQVLAQFGENQIMHWIIPPGTHFYTNDVTAQFRLPSDTTIHYATGHLHPFGRRLTLLERQADGKESPLVTITAKSRTDRLGIEEISEIKSRDGIPIHQNSKFTLVTEYDNPTGKPIDAMSILYLYMAE